MCQVVFDFPGMYQNQLSQAICLIALGVLAVSDWKRRTVSMYLLLSLEIAALFQNFCTCTEVRSVAAGVLTGLIFLTVSFLTGESIGYGDSLGILVLGTFLGIWDLMMVLIIAFSLSFLASLILYGRRILNRKDSVPFFPFLEVAYVMLVAFG